MAANIYDWDVVEANNATADSALTWAEGQAPSTVNNSARVMMRRGKEFLIDLGGSLVAGGTANALTLTAQSAFTALADGRIVSFKAIAINTGAATLNVNAIGTKAIMKMTGSGATALVGGEIQTTGMYTVQYSAALNGGAGAWLLINATGGGAPKGLLHGLTLSNNIADATNDIDIAIGEGASDVDPFYRMVLASALTKQLDAAWVVGNNVGGRMSAAAIANTTYHVWLIQRSDTGVVDVGFDVSATAPTMPANYDRKRRIGSIIRAGGAIVAFYQVGDVFKRPFSSLSFGSTTAAALLTLAVPTGIVVQPIINSQAALGASGVIQNLIGSAQNGGTEIIYQQIGANQTDYMFIPGGYFTNTSAQIYFACVVSGTILTNNLLTLGWIDTRGQI